MKKIISITFFALVGVLSFALQGGFAHADWSTLNSSTTKEFTDISCPDSRICYLTAGLYISGGTGAIFKTTDGGETFSPLTFPTLDPLHAISCPSVSVCYVVGDFGTFLKTANGGETWSHSLLGTRAGSPKFTNVWALDENIVLVIGRDAALYRSEDGGATWGRPAIRTVSDLYALYFLDKKNGFVAGDDGALFVTEDGGATWSYRNTLRTEGQIVSISGDGNQTLYAVGDSVNTSTDGGRSWTKRSATSKSQIAVVATSGSTAYLLGDMNSVEKTANGGATWQVDTSIPNALLRNIICPSASYCFIVGSTGKVLRLGTPPAPTPPPPPPAPVVVPVPPPVVLETPQVVVPTEPPAVRIPKASVSATFTRTLRRGATGEDVKKLQELLAAVGGVYPDGEITGYFGPATAKAVGRFQEKYNLAKPREAGYGDAGPKTRVKLLEGTAGGAETGAAVETAKTPKATSATFARTLKKGSSGNDVKKLQELLSADKELYPEGEVSGYFGPATKRAVGRFQEKYGLATPEGAGYGELGPKTRAKLIETAF